MSKLFYIARDKAGRKINGSEDTISQDELITKLQAKGLTVINIMPEYKEGGGFNPQAIGKRSGKFKRYRITLGDLTVFCRQLSTLLGAGVTILKTLEIISQQVASRKLYNVLKGLQKYMEEGLSLHEAMAKYPEVFSDLWVNLVESGEASGNLAVILERLAKSLEKDAEFRRKIVSALIYPLILLLAGIGALLFLTIKIIPTFADLFTGFNVEMPLLTQILINSSVFIRKYILLMGGIIAAAFYLFREYIKTKDGRRKYENFKFKLPLFGEFFRVIVIERFSAEMSTLIESGVPILYSLEITEHSVGSLVMGDIIRKIKESVQQGKPLSKPFEESGFFEPMVIQMVSIGEEIGELSNMFKRINNFYQQYAETFVARFISLFEPIMLIVLGVLIGTMVLGMFLPIFKISSISGG